MDNLVFDEICDFKYRFLFSGADADRHCAWRDHAAVLSDFRNGCAVPKDRRNCARRIYDGDYYSVVYRKHHYDEPWDHWLLYCKDL